MKKSVIFFIGVSLSSWCFAHGRWVEPSHTVISGEKATFVSFDLSISNDIFHPDVPYGGKTIDELISTKGQHNGKPENKHSKPKHPLVSIAKSTRLSVLLPDGSTVNDSTIVSLGRKSVAALRLEQNGTYRVGVTQDPIYYTSFLHKSNEQGRIFGVGEKRHRALPEGAHKVQEVKLVNHVYTFVTRNNVSSTISEIPGSNVELKFSQHPNDLFAPEPLSITLLYKGQPLKGQTIKVIESGTRYRNNRDVQSLTTDDEGLATVTWPGPGMFLLETEIKMPVSGGRVDKEVNALYVTFEVFPE